MQFHSTLIPALLLALTTTLVSAAPQAAPPPPLNPPSPATIASLVPEFGVAPGQNPDGTGRCTTPIAPALIPCDCPPNRDAYLSQLFTAVKEGDTFGLNADFPTGTDTQSQIIRFQTMLAVLQSFRGSKGSGCPAISTTFKQSLDALS